MGRATEIPASVRAAVLWRAQGQCERCGDRPEHLELHHRKYRSRGGRHTVDNLVALCGLGNTSGCHGWAHSGNEPVTLGWSLHSWDDPAVTPLRRMGLLYLLGADGTVTLVTYGK